MTKKDYDNVTLYCNLKDVMQAHDNGTGISANRLSQVLDVRRSTLNDLIANNDMHTRRIPATLIAKLCAFFDCSPCDLFEIVDIKAKK